eukprot:TRINITY_DN292_c0_g1_i1.p1 TRINITY_DN292_c0_g1~~TRINITY_DN292_c0_g1_i1.p1  ORF type:complete len:174 (-),score=24.98 TRINITY_DN292_c0_g1_i1:116-637(-)
MNAGSAKQHFRGNSCCLPEVKNEREKDLVIEKEAEEGCTSATNKRLRASQGTPVGKSMRKSHLKIAFLNSISQKRKQLVNRTNGIASIKLELTPPSSNDCTPKGLYSARAKPSLHYRSAYLPVHKESLLNKDFLKRLMHDVAPESPKDSVRVTHMIGGRTHGARTVRSTFVCT